MKVTINKRVFNKAFHNFIDSDNHTEVLMGGASAGKSHATAQRLVMRMLKYPNYNTLALRKVSATNHDSTFALMRQIITYWNVGKLFRINESKGDEKITCANGSQMLFKGLKDEKEREKVKSVTFQGGVLNHVWMEEASEFYEKDLDQMRLRLRGQSPYPKQITLTFNPIIETHWLKKRFWDNPTDAYVLHTTYKDNAFLEEDDEKAIEALKETDLIYYEIYALGKWGRVGNVVFRNYEIKEVEYPYNEETGEQLEPDEYFDRICQGMDFGYDHPSVFERIGFKDDRPYWFEEVALNKMTNTEWAEYLERKYERMGCLREVMKTRTIADSAEPDRIREFRKRGWNMTASKKGKGSHNYGVDYLRSKQMTIDPKCVRMKEEVQSYRNREDASGEAVAEEYVKEFDDAIAASRYATEEIWNKWKAKAGKISAAKLGL